MTVERVIILIAVVLGFTGSVLLVWIWIHWRRRNVVRMVRDGVADWAALALITVSARHLDGGTERPGNQPFGFVSVKNATLSWTPNRSARKRGHRDAVWALSDLRLLHAEKRRLPTAIAIRELHLAVKDEVVVLWLYTEAGPLPAWFTFPE